MLSEVSNAYIRIIILGIRVKEHMRKPKIDAVKKDITSACSEHENEMD